MKAEDYAADDRRPNHAAFYVPRYFSEVGSAAIN
jgi:hypothetical protein